MHFLKLFLIIAIVSSVILLGSNCVTHQNGGGQGCRCCCQSGGSSMGQRSSQCRRRNRTKLEEADEPNQTKLKGAAAAVAIVGIGEGGLTGVALGVLGEAVRAAVFK